MAMKITYVYSRITLLIKLSLIYCRHLIEATSSPGLASLDLTSADRDSISGLRLSPYDVKGLFVSSSVQLLNEQDYDTKRHLEELLKLLCKFSRVSELQNSVGTNVILTVIEDWICQVG